MSDAPTPSQRILTERRRLLEPGLQAVLIETTRYIKNNTVSIAVAYPDGTESYTHLSFAEANALAEMLQNVLHPKTPPPPSPFGRRFEHNPTD